MTVGQLRRKEFISEVRSACFAALSVDSADAHTRGTMNLLKIHFNPNYRIHYELMISSENGLIEIGLHFEDGPESTSNLLAFFDRYVVEIKHELGADFELERWTKSWGHFFEVVPLQPLTRQFARTLGKRLSVIVEVLQPLLEEAVATGVASDTPRPASARPRFGRRM